MTKPRCVGVLASLWVVAWALSGHAAEVDAGALTLMGFGPEYTAYVARLDGSAPTAYITRDADGPVTLEWSSGMPDVAFHVQARTATLEGLPAGVYTVRWWNGQTRVRGKTLLSGVGMAEDVTVGARPRHLSLTPPDGVAAPTRLNIVWGDLAIPGGVRISVDNAFVGLAFDSAELSVFGLGKGERSVSIRATGYRPVTLIVALDARRESTRFVRLQRLDGR